MLCSVLSGRIVAVLLLVATWLECVVTPPCESYLRPAKKQNIDSGGSAAKYSLCTATALSLSCCALTTVQHSRCTKEDIPDCVRHKIILCTVHFVHTETRFLPIKACSPAFRLGSELCAP